MRLLIYNGKTSRYTYNAAGERIVKSHGYLEGVYVNGAPQGLTFHETEDYTIYPAPILSVTRQRFTKHYFIGDRRVASKIGAGIFQNAYGHGANVVTAGQKDYQMRMMQIEKQREDYYRKLGTPPGVPTMKGATAEPENTHEGYNTIIRELGDHSVPDGWIQRPKRNAVPGTPPGPPVQWDKAEDPDDVQPGYGYVPADTAHHEDIFYYHTDHLGSTSYITDTKANVAQFGAYLPYGELLVDEHSSTEEMPYKFNGKELDEETGLYYYGARYMNPRTSLWYGVDPLAEKYPSVSSLIYCFDNPIKFIDPDGRKTKKPTLEEIVTYGKKNSTTFASLMKLANINMSNLNTEISFGDETSTTPSTGHISLTKSTNIKRQIIKLTHEFSNRINRHRLLKATEDVKEGIIAPKKYAEELIRIEFEGQINQIKVASEIEYRYPKNGGGGANKLIDRYSADKTIKLRKKMVPSKELKQFYIKQGGALRNEARRNQRHKL